MEIGFSFCDEIEEKIMLKLPTKSLSRFKCVSKTWYNRITSSSEFARNHLQCQRQISQSNNLNLMLHGGRGPMQSVSCSSIYIDKDAKKIQHNQPLLVDLNDHKFNIVGSCDGLLLVVATTSVGLGGFIAHVIYIWNPTTGEYKRLPKLKSYSYMRGRLPKLTYYSYIKSCKNFIEFGFGRDLSTDNNNHYKVLLLETVLGDTGLDAKFMVNMYTTYTNSWKKLVPEFPYLWSQPRMILAYDNLHYMAQTEDDDNPESVVSFDLKDDKFRVLPMVLGTFSYELCALNGDLCAISRVGTGNDYNLWRMENFGVMKEECWTKICSIYLCLAMDKPFPFISPLHVLEDGQILLYAPAPGPGPGPFIISYNTENKKACFLVQANGSFSYIPVVYEESFISPNAASTAEEKQPRQLKRSNDEFCK